MDNEENLAAEEQDNGGETVDKQTTEDTVYEPVVEDDKHDYKQMFEDQRKRAVKAEEQIKELKKTRNADPEKVEKINDPLVQPDELRLIAKGLTDEEIAHAKTISKGLNIPLGKAIANPLFTAWQTQQKETEKKERAKLGGSKGSTTATSEPLVKSGMSKEDHRKVWQEIMGKIK